MAFATIPVLEEAGWSDDGMHSVVRVDPTQVADWVAGLLHDQDEGKTEQLAYSPENTTASVFNDTDINGLAAAVSGVLDAKGFGTGAVGNYESEHVAASQVQAARPTTPARRRWPGIWAGCRWSPTSRCPPARYASCSPTTTPGPARA